MEEQILFSYPPEVYDDLCNKVSERGYMRLFYEIRGSKYEPGVPPENYLITTKYFTDKEHLASMVAAIQLEVKRTELGKFWKESGVSLDSMLNAWWDSDLLTIAQIQDAWNILMDVKHQLPSFYSTDDCGISFLGSSRARMMKIIQKNNHVETPIIRTLSQRIVSLLHLLDKDDYKSKIMAVMMAPEAWVCDPLDGVWKFKKELLAKKISNMTEQEVGKWETFKDPIVDELMQRSMTDGQKQILEGLMQGEAFRTVYWFEYFGYVLVNKSQKQRIIVLEYLRSLPKK